jgi:DegV family protein with EDD domain
LEACLTIPMEKIAVITDSVACLPREMAEQNDILIVPAGNIYHEGKSYRDWIDLTYAEAYNILETAPDEFFTGPTTPGEFLDIFRELAGRYPSIIYISLSSKFSTVPNAARVAAGMAKQEMPELKIEVFDSATATGAQGFIALAAARAVKAGKSLEEVLKVASEVRKRVDLFYVLDTVAHVHRTGRVPRSLAVLGSKLRVKPLVTVRNGAALILGLVRNRERAIDSLLRVARKEIKDRPVHIAILHARAASEAEILKQRISEQLNCVELWVGEFSPLMVYATGKGIIGVAFCPATEYF